jgi:hypothetical protein
MTPGDLNARQVSQSFLAADNNSRTEKGTGLDFAHFYTSHIYFYICSIR